MAEETHVGDGVYVSHDGYQIWLRTDNGGRIALDPGACQGLAEWARDFYAKYNQRSPLQLEESKNG